MKFIKNIVLYNNLRAAKSRYIIDIYREIMINRVMDYLENGKSFSAISEQIQCYEYSKGGISYGGFYTKSLYSQKVHKKLLGKLCKESAKFNFKYGFDKDHNLIYEKFIVHYEDKPDYIIKKFTEVYENEKLTYVMEYDNIEKDYFLSGIEMEAYNDAVYSRYDRFSFFKSINDFSVFDIYTEEYKYFDNQLSNVLMTQGCYHYGLFTYNIKL
jgi:hypothetical protein